MENGLSIRILKALRLTFLPPISLAAAACARAPAPAVNTDSAFAAVQDRGALVMGVDQYTSTHVFEDLPDGGRIVLQRNDASDSASIDEIRRHMRTIAAAFERGDFQAPGLVHARQVPGTEVMRKRRTAIGYTVVDRARGAELRITTTDVEALRAVHSFLAFQRMDHRAAGHEAHSHGPE